MSPVTKTLSLATLGFAALLLGGADGGCTIHITPIEECTDLDEVCPNLQCDEYVTNDEGCPICECADGPPPHHYCGSDQDCGPGQYCAYDGYAPTPYEEEGQGERRPGSDDDEPGVMPYPEGVCRPLAEPCDDGTEALCTILPPDCGPSAVLAVQNSCFVCVEPETCQVVSPPPPLVTCANVRCGEDSTCIETPEGPECVDRQDICYSDQECGPRQRCEPMDTLGGRCVEVGACRDDGPAVCDVEPPDCQAGTVLVVRDLCYVCVDPDTCEPPAPPFGCMAALCAPDTQCVETDDGPRCVPVEGRCYDDADCADRERCEYLEQCYEECWVDSAGQGGCEVVCHGGELGRCVEREPAPEGCYGEQDCAEGQRCNASEVCLPPPGCDDPDLSCPRVCYGFCED